MRLVIGGPTRDIVPASFAVDLAQLYAKERESGRWAAVVLGFVGATYVHVGREAVLDAAIQARATHLLWLDTDMTFPPETALRLMLHDRPLVACNYVMRNDRRMFTAERHGRSVSTVPTSSGLEAVDSVGFGVLLMRTDVAMDLPRPWFRHGQNAETGADVGEDRMFCRAVRATGHEIVIDHDLSKEVGHIGQYTYRPHHQATLTV
jgi:hypothetical protein